MDLDRIISLFSRVATLVSAVFVAVAGAEWLANFFGQTMLRQMYTPGRLLEFAGILMLFVLTMLMRQVRDELRRRNA